MSISPEVLCEEQQIFDKEGDSLGRAGFALPENNEPTFAGRAIVYGELAPNAGEPVAYETIEQE